MNFAITARVRTLLVFLSAGAYVASLSDFSERLEAQDLVGTQSAFPRVSVRRPPPPIEAVVRRDPFAGEPGGRSSGGRYFARGAASEDLPYGDAYGPGGQDGTGGNGGQDGPQGDAEALVVRATIVGSHSVAYVEQGSNFDLVRVGDVLAGRRVTTIDLRGIALSDGSRLDLPDGYLATPAPPPPAPESRADAALDAIARLRAQLSERQSQPALPGPASPPEAAPAQATTPGPLPTVDARGLPVGVNPTPDVSGPTPFPYPYPYAPARR
jgi:hypothetical protein